MLSKQQLVDNMGYKSCQKRVYVFFYQGVPCCATHTFSTKGV